MISHKKLLQICNLLPEHSTGIGVAHQLSAVRVPDDDAVGVDVDLALNGSLGGFKGL